MKDNPIWILLQRFLRKEFIIWGSIGSFKQEQIFSLKVGTKAVIDNEMLKMQWNVK